ncbi:unnamed protein product, partial [Prorocentrum cordatum]
DGSSPLSDSPSISLGSVPPSSGGSLPPSTSSAPAPRACRWPAPPRTRSSWRRGATQGSPGARGSRCWGGGTASCPTRPRRAHARGRLPRHAVRRPDGRGGRGPVAPAGPAAHKELPPAASETARVVVKGVGIGLVVIVLVVAVANWPPWMIEDWGRRRESPGPHSPLRGRALRRGPGGLRDFLDVNKSSVMLIMSATMWAFLAVGYHPTRSEAGYLQLHEELSKGIQDGRGQCHPFPPARHGRRGQSPSTTSTASSS